MKFDGAYVVPLTGASPPVLWIWPLYKQWLAVILFIVSVPVLSLAMHVVLPSVSMVSRFLTNTLMSFILTAVRVRATVS